MAKQIWGGKKTQDVEKMTEWLERHTRAARAGWDWHASSVGWAVQAMGLMNGR
jgi:hypothetical protein